ncbi:hypothetical protein Q9L58_003063 [Maublancomyces gigas]|uniref:Uncharacterized protein n=1 Tax=Discina gigas TaxID=1032678 RepID=A0ABR3GPY4_9PEZI
MFPSTSFADSTSTYTNGHTNPSLARRDGNPPGQSPYQSQQQQQQRQQSHLLAQQQLQHQQLLQQQQQQQQAGMVNMFPTAAGHQLDLNHLWQQVQELSTILAANRESTAGLVRRADEIRREHAASTINIHQTYTNQLQSERQQNAILRQNETESQTRLTTISKLLREAYQNETALEPDILIEGLKVENEALREALGLPKDDEGREGDSERSV